MDEGGFWVIRVEAGPEAGQREIAWLEVGQGARAGRLAEGIRVR